MIRCRLRPGLTLNQLARTSKKEIDKQLQGKLDRPTRFTLRAIQAVNSTSKTMTSTVKVKDKRRANGKSETDILKHLFAGGGRSGKGAEGALRALGVLPSGMFIVPGKFAPLDSFGNIKRSFIRKLIEYFKSFRPKGNNTSTLAPGVWMRKFDRREKKSRKKQGKSGSFEFFVVHKQIDAATSKRSGSKRQAPEPILLFVDRPRYRKYFDMLSTTAKVIIRDLDREFAKQYEFALKTAKKI